jgi:hypothetical protein
MLLALCKRGIFQRARCFVVLVGVYSMLCAIYTISFTAQKRNANRENVKNFHAHNHTIISLCLTA